MFKLQVVEEDLLKVQEEHAHMKHRLQQLCLLRQSLAPAIEGLLLLDKVAFLLEQVMLCSTSSAVTIIQPPRWGYTATL